MSVTISRSLSLSAICSCSIIACAVGRSVGIATLAMRQLCMNIPTQKELIFVRSALRNSSVHALSKLHVAVIDAFEYQRKLASCNRVALHGICAGPRKRSLFKALGQTPEPIAIPIQDLQSVFPSIAEREHMP